MTRFSAAMLGLSLVFWFTSWPLFSMGRGFPNCVSARVYLLICDLNFVSNHQVSSAFVTPCGSMQGSFWSERSDGYCCSWIPHPTPADQSGWGFGIVLSREAIGWDCPYWLMSLIWGMLMLKTKPSWRFRTLDVLYAMTLIGVVATSISVGFQLPILVFMNLATACMLLLIAISGLQKFFSEPIYRLPLLFVADQRKSNADSRSRTPPT